jgi:hypothetical protein
MVSPGRVCPNPALLLDQVVLLVGPGRGADRGDVGAQTRLGHGERGPDLAGGHLGQEAGLLLGGAVLGDQVGHDEMGVDDPRDAHPASGQFLGHQRVGQ